MRRLFALVLATLVTLPVQTASVSASVSGRAVSAAGQAMPNQRVDLVRAGEVVNVVTTDTRGGWSFAHVAAGEYVVRATVHGKVAGVRVQVTDGTAVTAATIVVPTAAVAPQFGAFASLLGPVVGAAGGAAASAAAALGISTEATNLSAEEVVAIFNKIEDPVAQRDFAAAVATSAQVTGNNGGSAFQPVPQTGGGSAGSDNNAAAAAVFNVFQQIADPTSNISRQANSTGNGTIVLSRPTIVVSSNGTGSSLAAVGVQNSSGTVIGSGLGNSAS